MAEFSAAADGRPPRGLILGLLTILGLRLLAAALIPLTEDEAYYRLWAQAPAFGYVDHPPMIAWWTALGMRLAGDDPLGVRLLPSLASFATSLIIFDLARLAGARRAASVWAVILFNASLLVAFGGFLAVPDAPAAFFWSLTLWSLLRAEASGRFRWWATAGLSAGLATISKYSALFLGPGVLIWLLWTPERRRLLATLGPWLALVLAGAVFATNLVWNATHGWLTFDKQFGRIAAHRLTWRYLPELLIGQAILLNPFTTALMRSLRWRGAQERLGLFVATSLPFALYLVVHSLHDRVQAHWPAPLYPAAAIIAAVAAEQSAAWVRRAAPAFTVVILAVVAILALVPGRFFARAPDPFLPLRGWSGFETRLEAERRASGAAWVATTSYGLASQLAASHPAYPLWQISERDRWLGPAPGALPDLRRPGIVIDLARRLDAAKLSACFADVRPLAPIPRGRSVDKPKRYAVFLVDRPTRDILAQGCW